MACASCGGKARLSSSSKLTRNSGTTTTSSSVKVVNSQTVEGNRVQTAVASYPNSPTRTKI